MSALDLRALLAGLQEHDVSFVVIGGVAVGAHGYVRATVDLDIVPDPERANLLRLGNFLVAAGATLPMAGGRAFEHPRDGSALRRGGNLTVDTPLGPLDVVQRATGVVSFKELAEAAVQSELLGIPVRVCALRHLRQMKDAAGRAQDRADLEHLPLD